MACSPHAPKGFALPETPAWSAAGLRLRIGANTLLPGRDILIFDAELRLRGGAFGREQGTPMPWGPGSWPLASWDRHPQANFTGGQMLETNDGRFWTEPVRGWLLALTRDRDPAGRFSFGVSPSWAVLRQREATPRAPVRRRAAAATGAAFQTGIK